MARNLDDTARELIKILRKGGQASNALTAVILEGRDDIITIITKAMKQNKSQTEVIALIHKEMGKLLKTASTNIVRAGVTVGKFEAKSSFAYLSLLGVDDPALFNVTETFIRRVFKTPMAAQNISVSNLFTGVMSGIDQQMVNVTRTAYAAGDTISTTTRFIREASGGLDDATLRRKAEALGRTAISQVANSVRAESFLQEDEVRGILYVATLDHRTTKNICAPLDGHFWEKKSDARIPPLHVSCRSTTTPVLKGESLDSVKDQLRRPAVEVKSVKALNDKGLKTRTGRVRKPSSRNSSPLKGVVKQDYVNYEQWLKQQPVTYQKEILGPKAFGVFSKSGKLTPALGVLE